MGCGVPSDSFNMVIHELVQRPGLTLNTQFVTKSCSKRAEVFTAAPLPGVGLCGRLARCRLRDAPRDCPCQPQPSPVTPAQRNGGSEGALSLTCITKLLQKPPFP